MNKSKFQKAFKEVLCGKSLREIERVYGISRDQFINVCKKEFPEGSKGRKELEEILRYNKANSTTKYVEKEKMERVVKKFLKNEIDLDMAASIMELHKQTFLEKLDMYIRNIENSEMKEQYKTFCKKRIPENQKDYKKAKKLVDKAKTKTGTAKEIAESLGVSVSTLRRAKIKVNQYEETFKKTEEISKTEELEKKGKIEEANQINKIKKTEEIKEVEEGER